MDRRGECVKVAGFNRALCAAWRGDNAGPPDAAEVLAVFAAVQADFPSARVVASGFDAFSGPLAEAVAAGAVADLPVVTSEVRLRAALRVGLAQLARAYMYNDGRGSVAWQQAADALSTMLT